MSLKTESSEGYSRPPPAASFPQMNNSGDFQSLPSMSSLLRQDYGGREAQNNAFVARQFQPPYNMIKQPQRLANMDPIAVDPSSRPLPQDSHYPQEPSGSEVAPPKQPEQTLGLPPYRSIVPQPRIERKISQRKDTPKEQAQGRRVSTELPRRPFQQATRVAPIQTNPSHFRQEPVMHSPSREMPPSHSSRSMPISGLLSGPPPRERSPPRHPAKYTLSVRQQPLAARACGFGERDRRVIDPPPILQMHVENPNASAEEVRTLVRQPFSVVHCVLWDPVANRDDTAMPGTSDKRQQRRLMGTLVSSPFVGNDEHGVEGCFFAFPDLSVRTPGTYSLKFSLVILDPARMIEGHREHVKSVVWSSAFHVYNAKDFCGMRASSALTKALKTQGCLISVKKGNSRRPRDNADEDDEEDDDDDEESTAQKRGGKRSRR